MRTEPPSPLTSALARLRPPAGRVRRWLAARGTATRVVLLLVVLAPLGTAGYLASIDDSNEQPWAWIYQGRKLSLDDVNKISETLDAASIPHLADSATGRVGVKPSKRAEALAVLAKAKVVPPTLEDISNEAEAVSVWEGPDERERRDNLRLEKLMKAEIEGLDPSTIASAHVTINRVKRRSGLGSTPEITCSVYIKTEGGRRLGHRVVEGIETFLTGSVPGLKPEGITVADHTGHKYLSAGNPLLKEQMQTHAREEDWRDKIAEALRHIPGVGVDVLLETVPAPPPEVPPATAVEVTKVNGSVVLEPDPPAVAPPSPAHPPRTKANVWIRVPRSFYLLEFQSRSPNRPPTPEDLEPMRITTEKVIRDAVEIHIPKDELGAVKVGVIQDDLASSRPLLLPPVSESHRSWSWVALSGGAAVAGVMLIVGLIRLATWRPLARPSRSAWRPGFVADGPSGPVPGPSERVRELIRLNPEAAAGVLQRWIGQGGALE